MPCSHWAPTVPAVGSSIFIIQPMNMQIVKKKERERERAVMVVSR